MAGWVVVVVVIAGGGGGGEWLGYTVGALIGQQEGHGNIDRAGSDLGDISADRA